MTSQEAKGTSSRFAASLGAGVDGASALDACLENLQDWPAGANLGFVYITDTLAGELADVLGRLQARSPVRYWVGTVGSGVVSSGLEVHDRPAVSILVCAMPEDSFRVFETDAGRVDALSQDHGGWLASQLATFAVVHADPRTNRLSETVAELSNTASAFLFGGLSGGQGQFPQIADCVVEGGLSGVLLGSEQPVAVGLSQGCSPIGPSRIITAAEQNVIMTIDDRPALEVFKEDIGDILARDLRRVAGYIYVAFPILGSDTGDYLVRNLTGIDPQQGWIAVGEAVTPGMSVMFCRRDHQAADRDLRRMLADVKARAGGPIRAGLYCSCIARGPNLFGPDSEELKVIEEELGRFPLSGFFANGEISNDRLYGYTGVLALFL